MANRMSNKKIKRKKGKGELFDEEDSTCFMMFGSVFIIILVAIFVSWLLPKPTLYVSASRFPLKVPDMFFKNISSVPAEYIFYGTPQPNGTECISSVAVYKYNQTSHTISSVLLNYSTNPEVVSNMYWSVSSDFTEYPPHYHGPMSPSPIGFFISPDVTLLCPNIINATNLLSRS